MNTYTVMHMSVKGKHHMSSACEDLIEEECFYLKEEKGVKSEDITITTEVKVRK